ncbi:MAG: Asp-tRNA(Asn)/Glu-tRNA(Gln) amidotransferase subunit GatA [Deltaproteobacteria bacterium]|nr:Asp-tRNA(Asn)/Glu-tRNA(Gln) amidotransferase subunit GatA [Deltaproteobacteria bacterium]
MTIAEHIAAVAGGASVRERAEAALDRVGDDPHRAFLSLDRDWILADAEQLDARLAAGESLPLAGAPIAIKDNLCQRGTRTTCGSRLLEDWVAPYDATVVERLRAAGALLFGKTNLDEFAMGSSTENSAFGPTSNPRDPSRVPGGSSGGSAATVAAGHVAASLGSDTGGSVRQPAAYCGVHALKPTYGRVSRRGLVAFASSLDQVGPFGATVADIAQVYDVIAGPDAGDATSADQPAPSAMEVLGAGVAGLRIGVVRSCLEQADAPVAAAVEGAAERLESAGATLVDVGVEHLDLALSAYYLIAPAEAASNLSRFDGARYGLRVEGRDLAETYRATRARFGREVIRRIVLGTYALSEGYADEAYVRASRARTAICRAFDSVFEGVDLLLLPTAPTVAFALGEKTDDPVAMYAADVFTVPASLAGLPASSSPVGEVDGLPVGAQLIGRRFEDTTLVRAMEVLSS